MGVALVVGGGAVRFFFVLFAMLICGWGGAYVAKARGKPPAIWAVICALSPLAGVLLLAASSRSPAKRPQLSFAKAGMFTTGSFSQADLNRWKALVELDPDIAAAAAIAREKGIGCEMMLAEKYLTLNDKSYLQPALEEALAESAKKADANL